MTLALTYALLSALCIALLGGLFLVSFHLSQQDSPWWEGALCGVAVSGGALAMAWCLLR